MSSARSQRDPIEHVRKLLLDEAGVEKEELKKIEKVTFAEAGLADCTRCRFFWSVCCYAVPRHDAVCCQTGDHAAHL